MLCCAVLHAVLLCLQGAAGYKADRDAARKRDAGNRSAWSTLFMRPDTVAAAVAAHYGVSKAQLLDAGAEDLPLRMALGEAQVCVARGYGGGGGCCEALYVCLCVRLSVHLTCGRLQDIPGHLRTARPAALGSQGFVCWPMP